MRRSRTCTVSWITRRLCPRSSLAGRVARSVDVADPGSRCGCLCAGDRARRLLRRPRRGQLVGGRHGPAVARRGHQAGGNRPARSRSPRRPARSRRWRGSPSSSPPCSGCSATCASCSPGRRRSWPACRRVRRRARRVRGHGAARGRLAGHGAWSCRSWPCSSAGGSGPRPSRAPGGPAGRPLMGAVIVYAVIISAMVPHGDGDRSLGRRHRRDVLRRQRLDPRLRPLRPTDAPHARSRSW